MVVLVAKQAVNTGSLPVLNVSANWKNGTGSVKAEKNGKLWYKITEIEASTQKKFEKLLKSEKKLFQGDDTFTGSAFADTLTSFDGKDLVKAGEGADTVRGGNAADRLFGEGGDDAMSGDAGADLLVGGKGRNTLTGGDGKDSFQFNAALDSANRSDPANQSTITDFRIGADTLELDRSVFKGIGTKGNLSGDSFFLYPDVTKTPNEHSVIYDKALGELWYTEDGSIISAILFAKVTPGVDLSSKDFLIV